MAVLEIDEGFDYKVAVVDDRWVVRVARRPAVAEGLELEAALLRRIAPALPVEVPQFALVSREPAFAVYPLLRGTPLAGEDPDGVRAFLQALHAIETDVLPPTDWIERYRSQCNHFVELVFPLLEPSERARANALFAEVESLAGFEPCVIHGDLGAEHMLVRDGRLAAVIDWADASLGDPALDYAWLANEVFPNWTLDAELRRRADFYYRLAPFYSVHYGVFRGNADYAARALVKVRERL